MLCDVYDFGFKKFWCLIENMDLNFIFLKRWEGWFEGVLILMEFEFIFWFVVIWWRWLFLFLWDLRLVWEDLMFGVFSWVCSCSVWLLLGNIDLVLVLLWDFGFF